MYHHQQQPYMYPAGQAQAQLPQAAAAATALPAASTSSSSSSTPCVIDNKTRDMGVQATAGPSMMSGTTGSAAVTISVSASPTVSAMSGINTTAVAAAAAPTNNTSHPPVVGHMSVSAVAVAATAAAAAAEVSGESDRDGGSRPTSTSPPTSPNLGAAVAPGAASTATPTASAGVTLPSPVVPASAAAAAAVPSSIPAVSPPRPSQQPATTAVASTNTSISIPTSSSPAAAAATTAASDRPAKKSTQAPGKTEKKKKQKKRQSTEFKMLESDSKEILGRIAAQESNMTSRRAFAYEPSLEIFREYSFSDYVRGALLGVEGVVDWESSDEEDDEEEDGGNAGNQEMKKQEGEAPAEAPTKTAADEMDVEADGTASASTTSGEKGSPEKDLTPTRKSARQAARKARGRKKSDPLPPEKPARISARIKARKEDEVVEDDGSAGGGGDKKKKCCNGDHHGKNDAVNFDIFEDMPIPNEMLLADGIAKITPPEGWWDHAGIGGDLTGRGPIWSKGGRLGDMEVTTPIKQCASGIGGVYEYTMLELPPVPVHEFRDRADQYRKRQIREDHNDDTSDEYMDVLARKFWKRLGPTMEASVYGADMEGTLFDGADACGWNIDRLESALALLGADMDEEGAAPGEPAGRLPGVTTAYLYYGMWGSTFAAHTEDMNLLSINYLHAGAPKFWYAIDPKDSKRYESLATSLFPAAARDCPEFLRHKRYLISPSILSKAGISYTTQVQRAGDAIITFPNAYHFGFNTGFNVAESTNFAVPEWLPYGKSANVCLCHPHSVRIDMDRFQELLGQYEMRNARLHQLQRKRLTYSEFARAEVARRRKEEARYVSEEDDEAEEEEPIRYGSVRPVEVVQMKTSSNTPAAIARRNNSKKSAASRKKAAQPRETWRRAKQAWPSSFREGAQVLCYVPAAAENYDEEGQHSEKCFSGTVIDACEGHIRVRFDGTQRKDDLWVKLDGRKVFLDDGPVNRDTDSEDESEPTKKNSAAKKKPASKKRKVN